RRTHMIGLALMAPAQAAPLKRHSLTMQQTTEGVARIVTVGREAAVCWAMAPECTIPILTGRPATTHKARKFPRAVAISVRKVRGLGHMHGTPHGQIPKNPGDSWLSRFCHKELAKDR